MNLLTNKFEARRRKFKSEQTAARHDSTKGDRFMKVTAGQGCREKKTVHPFFIKVKIKLQIEFKSVLRFEFKNVECIT